MIKPSDFDKILLAAKRKMRRISEIENDDDINIDDQIETKSDFVRWYNKYQVEGYERNHKINIYELERSPKLMKQFNRTKNWNKKEGTATFRMSFYHNTLDKEYAIYVIQKTQRPILYTIGYKWKNPTTVDKPISKEDAIDIIMNEDFVDVDAFDNAIYINTYSVSDLY